MEQQPHKKVKRLRKVALAQLQAAFYPKLIDEMPDHEVRMRMQEVVAAGHGVLEVSMKHSGSLFLYSGDNGGAFAKNSYGNLCTAVGVYVLGSTLREAWGEQAGRIQHDFNAYLEEHRICIGMELVTAALEDHGQRPLHDYVVVTAVTKLDGRPHFQSTPEVIAFCHQWKLPTNQYWFFSTKASLISFFTAYDALSEEGLAENVTRVLNDIADTYIPATKRYEDILGQILEGLVARIVPPQCVRFPRPPSSKASSYGKQAREICSSNKHSERKQIEALLEAVGSDFCSDLTGWFKENVAEQENELLESFLHSSPADHTTRKLQEMIQVIHQSELPVHFLCNKASFGETTEDFVSEFKLTVQVHTDSVFKRYQTEMSKHPGLWPLYRGLFVSVRIFHGEVTRGYGEDTLDDEAQNLMLKLKFLPYKIRTALIRDGIEPLFDEGMANYKQYYTRLMKAWSTSQRKQEEVAKLLNEWAGYITKKLNGKKLSSSTYLSEAEPFLKQYAAQVLKNGNRSGEIASSVTINRAQGMLVFFPGLPGCAKSSLCKAITPSTFQIAIHSLMGDLIKGKYWPQVKYERVKNPFTVTFADKNAPNREVWDTIENICSVTKAIGVPIVPESEGTEFNPYSLDVLAIFIYRVLQRTNHPGKLDQNSPNPGYVLLMFYNLYHGLDRSKFEEELEHRFGHIVKLPVLQSNRKPMPTAVTTIIQEGLDLYTRHTNMHGRLESLQGALKYEWKKWETSLKETMLLHRKHLVEVQVPFATAVEIVQQQLAGIANGDFTMHVKVKGSCRKFR